MQSHNKRILFHIIWHNFWCFIGRTNFNQHVFTEHSHLNKGEKSQAQIRFESRSLQHEILINIWGIISKPAPGVQWICEVSWRQNNLQHLFSLKLSFAWSYFILSKNGELKQHCGCANVFAKTRTWQHIRTRENGHESCDLINHVNFREEKKKIRRKLYF